MEIYLSSFAEAAFASLIDMDGAEVDGELLRARFADCCRDEEQMPMDPAGFDRAISTLDTDSLRRLVICISSLADGDTRKVVFHKRKTSEVIGKLVQFSTNLKLLSLELLINSGLRREEFVRHFAVFFEAGIVGESPAESADRLKRIDYRHLTEEAARAKASSEGRLEYLRKLKEQQEEKYAPRGKV